MPQGALTSVDTPPPPPAAAGDQQQPQGGALAGLPMPQPGAPQQAQPPAQMPAPSHQQTVATLRHFSAIGGELEKALRDPDVGKSDIRSKIIDGTTRLVAARIMPANEAVTMLASFPKRPFDQKQWLQQHMANVMKAEVAVLDHHRLGAGPGTGDYATEAAQAEPGDADAHMNTMNSMMSTHYGRGNA